MELMEDGESKFSMAVVYVSEIVVVIVLSLCFEAAQDKIRDTASTKDDTKQDNVELMDVVFKEITILGFIGLLVYLLTKTGAASDLADFIFEVQDITAEDNPLAETFEKVHMIIFCVMMVVIMQAAALWRNLVRLNKRWRIWEDTHAFGEDHDCFEQLLLEEDFIDADRQHASEFGYHQNRLLRVMDDAGIKALAMWRAIRHEFLFPVKEIKEGLRSPVLEVEDPGNFDFSSYLHKRQTEIIIDLIEIEPSTWIISLIVITPVVFLALSVSHDWIECLQFVLAWCLFAISFWMALNLSDIKLALTPVMPKNPWRILELLEGTSIGEFKRRVQLEKKEIHRLGSFVSRKLRPHEMGNSGEAQGPGDPLLQHDFESYMEPVQVQHKHKHRHREHVKKVHIFAPFRQQRRHPRLNSAGLRPWWIRMAGGDPGYVPNQQERLFMFEERGLDVYLASLEAIMFLQAVLVASLICSFFMQPIESTFEITLYMLAWAEWPMMFLWMVPRAVSQICIISSIEHNKDPEVIEQVIAGGKAARVTETLRMLRIVRMEGRIRENQRTSYGPDGAAPTITEKTFQDCTKAFADLTKSERRELDFHFKMLDADNSGEVSTNEIVPLFSTMGVVDSNESADALVQLVDRNHDKKLDIDEFRVLIMLATQRTSDEEEEEEFKQFFSMVDDDKSGRVLLDELVQVFTKMGMVIDENDLGELIYKCFGTAKMSLNLEDFITWIRFCESMQK